MLNSVMVILRLFGGAARAWWDDDALRLGASLAYYTLFAVAPILLVATAIAGAVFGEEAVRSTTESSEDPPVPLWTWLIVAAAAAFFIEGTLLRM